MRAGARLPRLRVGKDKPFGRLGTIGAFGGTTIVIYYMVAEPMTKRTKPRRIMAIPIMRTIV